VRPPNLPRIGFIPPLLPTLVDEPPAGDDWQHEIKHDGWRVQLVIDGPNIRTFTRNGHDYSTQMAAIVSAAGALHCTSAVIDGELIVQDEEGRSDYEALRRAMTGEPSRLVYYAFDLLLLDGKDLRRDSLEQRRECLFAVIGAHDPTSPIQFSEAVRGNAKEILGAACGLGLEGTVSKRRSSAYRSGRSTAWLKTKCYEEGEFLVLGAEHEPGKPAFALLAREGAERLEYAGSAFLTLSGASRDRFWAEIERLARPTPALTIGTHKKARWARPELRVRVQHLKGGDKLRHATVRELVT